MADNDTLYQWLFGGIGVTMLGGFSYLMTSIGKTSDDLATHKTLVAEKYLTKDDHNIALQRLEKQIDDGNKANLSSNEKIRAEVSQAQNTIVNMISNNSAVNNANVQNTAKIIEAIAATKVS